MPRVKRGVTSHKRHKKVLKRASGYWGGRHRLFKTANEAVMRGMAFAYRHRRTRKREMRRLWIVRINAAARQHGLSYSAFMHGLREANVTLDRKMLADLAVQDSAAFAKLANVAKGALPAAS